AEDGIRDGHVTGVQTCALPICLGALPVLGLRELLRLLDLPNTLAHQYPDGRRQLQPPSLCLPSDGPPERGWEHDAHGTCRPGREIGRASCRERVESAVVAGCLK